MKNIAIVCGGYSGEYQISIESALTIKENMDSKKYNSYIIVIEKNKWFFKDSEGKKYSINMANFSLDLNGESIIFDGIFNSIHGTPGEDGKLLAYFDMLGIPYSSCDVDVSALTFNKYLCNTFVKSLGVNVAKSVSFLKGEKINKDEVIENLGLPLFVKPARSGSSVGVSRVNTVDDFDGAINEAFKTDKRVLIEEFLDGREIDCGLFLENEHLIVLPLTEIISKNEFFDYEAKYNSNMADEITPPENLPIEQETDIKAVSSMLYRKLGCKGLVRLDFIITNTQLYLVEINAVPGTTENSIVPRQAKEMGISLPRLITAVVEGMFVEKSQDI